MSDANRVAGTIEFQINGTAYKAVGNFTYNLGKKKREAVPGADSVHGYKEMPQPAFIEGEIRTIEGLEIAQIISITNSTILLTLATGQRIMLADAWQEAEGTGATEEGTLPIRFCSASEGEEV